MRKFYRNRNVLVAGGTGLIGTPLVRMLAAAGANVTVASMDYRPGSDGVRCYRTDLREMSNCVTVCAGQEIVFNLVGVKGSPSATKRYPARFFVPILQTSINMMEAARRARVEHYLYTSTVGVYPPAEVFHESSMWEGNPSPNDWFAGWAKRMGELQADAYDLEYGWKASIVRPANVYGPHDNFDQATAMVLPSLIARVVESEPGTPLTVWGDGSAVRDFVHADDVARGMMTVMAEGMTAPVNLASGQPVTIGEVARLVARHAPGGPREVVFDPSQPGGDARRLMNVARALALDIHPQVTLEDGVRETIAWYAEHRATARDRYIAFEDKEHAQ